MNILILGSGGREAALAWKIARSPRCAMLYVAPGNGGTSMCGARNVDLNPMNFEAVERFVADNDINLLVVGNEDPLVAGITDYLAEHRPALPVVGPVMAGARLEGSKDYAKQFMMRHGIPTAAYRSFTADTLAEGLAFLESIKPPYVLKADGLAAGKGVLILPTLTEAREALKEMLGGKFGQSSSTVVVEQFLDGIECSVFVLTDGHGGYRILPVAKDYKRIGEGDTGLNTGGMGAVSPVAFADEKFMRRVEDRIILPTINGLMLEGIDYRGFIFFGLISVEGDPMVIEYNVRMGDPETEAVMPRIMSDLVDLLVGAAEGDLADLPLEITPRACATVMNVSAGYPESYAKGKIMSVPEHLPENACLFHAGTKRDNEGRLVTSGGRVIAASALGDTVADALERAYALADSVDYEGRTLRRDIGRDLMNL